MRKCKLSFLGLLFLSSANLIADEVILQGVDHGETNKGNRTEIPTPRVHADKNTVEITCDSLVTNTEVTITDFSGVILHRSSETLSPSNTLLFVSDTPEHSKYYIEIVTDDQIFFGYF